MKITTPEQLQNLSQNFFLGNLPAMTNSSICFSENAKNNIFFCEEGVHLVNSTISFNGCNCVLFLCKNRNNYIVNLSLNNNSVLYFGADTYINGCVNIILSEQQHFFIGNHCLLSFGIWIRTADPHLIYSCTTKQRLNPSQSVYIGDHVWLGQSVLILKGTEIDSGSIVGAMSVLSGKKIPHNCSYAGNPGRLIKSDIFWDGACVHRYTDSQTKKSLQWNTYISSAKHLSSDSYIYKFDPKRTISFSDMDLFFSQHTPAEIVAYLQNLPSDKNRFVHEDAATAASTKSLLLRKFQKH